MCTFFLDRKVMIIKEKIRVVPDFPTPGIQFYDITTLLNDAAAFRETIDQMMLIAKKYNPEVVVALESRGFFFGTCLALQLGVPFVPVRKKGKLPAETIEVSYAKEYGVDTIQLHKDALDENDIVLLHDDLLATGGTMKAACELVRKFGVKKIYVNFLVELDFLKGREIFDKDIQIDSLIHY